VTTLATLRGKLNNEIGVVTDADAAPWSVAARNQAISDGYAALWRAGVWRPVKQDIATVTDQWVYALTSIRRLDRLEVLDSSSRVIDRARGVVEPDDLTNETYQVRLLAPLSSAFTLRVRGYTAYVSVFANDTANDDLPAEHNRIPLLKAKAILYRTALGSYARYGERQAASPLMNLTVDQILGIISAAEREFVDEAKGLSRLRVRSGQARSV
jgi:hypothetical protein